MTIQRTAQTILAVLALAVPFVACSGGAAIGEACTTEADAGECTDGATCAKNKAGVLQCLKVCTAKEDCDTGTECTGTTGSTKVCQ